MKKPAQDEEVKVSLRLTEEEMLGAVREIFPFRDFLDEEGPEELEACRAIESAVLRKVADWLDAENREVRYTGLAKTIRTAAESHD